MAVTLLLKDVSKPVSEEGVCERHMFVVKLPGRCSVESQPGLLEGCGAEQQTAVLSFFFVVLSCSRHQSLPPDG